MSTLTANYGLIKPETTDSADLTIFVGQNMDKIDAQLFKKILKDDRTVSVTEYGAVGDGVTDDTKAFNDAISYLNSFGGGRLFVPATANGYLIVNNIALASNLHIYSNGAKFLKNASTQEYYVFAGYAGANLGYGSGVNNVVIEGVTLQGSFTDGTGASITLNRARNVIIRNCKFIECVISGHPLDLGGCDGVLVDNCEFFGQKATVGREYVEAIQCDNSTAEGNGLQGETFDGIGTKNVTVQNCRFLPYTDPISSTFYNAPNPIGSHSRVVGMWFTNIKFINNYVEDVTPSATSDGSGGAPYAVGWTHFYHVDGLEIMNNTFKNTSGIYARILGLYTIDTAIQSTDFNVSSPANQPYASQPCKNVKFMGNRIEGFDNPTGVTVIYMQGRDYTANANYPAFYYIENIRIEDNDFINCFDTTLNGGTSYNISADLISGSYVKSLNISDNYFNTCKRAFIGTNCYKTKFNDNDMVNVYWNPVNITNCDMFEAVHNTLDGCGAGFYGNACNKITISQNIIFNDHSNASASYDGIIQLKTCTRIFIKDNDLNGNTSTPYHNYHLYTGCDTAYVRDNISTIFLSPTISTDCTNILVS